MISFTRSGKIWLLRKQETWCFGVTLEWLACPRCCFAHCLFSGVHLTLTCQGQLLSLQMNPFPLLVGTFPLLLERSQGHWFFHTHPLSICLTQMPGLRCGAALVLSSGESLLLASCLNCSLSGFDQFGFLFLLWPPVRACWGKTIFFKSVFCENWVMVLLCMLRFCVIGEEHCPSLPASFCHRAWHMISRCSDECLLKFLK